MKRQSAKSSSGKTKARAKALPEPEAPAKAPKASKAAAAAAAEQTAPPVPRACEALVELCLGEQAFDDKTRGYTDEALQEITAEYERLQKGKAHVDALGELIGLAGYFQNLGYPHGAEQLKALALTSAPLLEQQRRAGWSR